MTIEEDMDVIGKVLALRQVGPLHELETAWAALIRVRAAHRDTVKEVRRLVQTKVDLMAERDMLKERLEEAYAERDLEVTENFALRKELNDLLEILS